MKVRIAGSGTVVQGLKRREKEMIFKKGVNIFSKDDLGFKILDKIAYEEVEKPYSLNVLFDDWLQWVEEDYVIIVIDDEDVEELNNFIKDHPLLKDI